MSLLRAPLFPDPDADAGHHSRTVLLHPGATLSETICDGYRANLPPRIVLGAREAEPLVKLSNPAVLVEAIKLADDRSGDVIVRLYESLGGRAETTISVTFPVATIQVVDLLERPRSANPVPVTNNELVLHPFEIVTLRLKRG